eukprot:gene5843-10907_t
MGHREQRGIDADGDAVLAAILARLADRPRPSPAEQQRDLAQRVKELQRSGLKREWADFADTQGGQPPAVHTATQVAGGGGVRDPAKHTAQFLRA